MGKLNQFKRVPVRKRKLRRVTPETLAELLAVHSSCLMDQQGKCPLLLSLKSLAWEINQVTGCTSEEDRCFRRTGACGGMLAAKPLNRVFECFNEELDDENRK